MGGGEELVEEVVHKAEVGVDDGGGFIGLEGGFAGLGDFGVTSAAIGRDLLSLGEYCEFVDLD